MVLASAEKIGAASPYLVLPISEVDTIVVENRLPAAEEAIYRKLGVALLAA